MSAAPLHCRLRACRAHAVVATSVHAAAVTAIWSSTLPAPLAVAITALLLLLAVREVACDAWRAGPRAVRRVEVAESGWWLHAADGSVWGPARPCAARPWPQALALTLRHRGGAQRRLLLLAGALDAEELRRLRVQALTALRGPEPAGR